MREPNDYERETLANIATQFSVKEDKLWEMYLGIMESNFEQDLWDIANENEEELKELSKGD